MDIAALASAINRRATEIYEGEGSACDFADAKDLLRALARLLMGESIRSAFGSPGDWGYNTPIGAALAAASPVAVTTASDTVGGVLEVGRNDAHEVVVNHPDLKADENGVGHIVFSQHQARSFANLLIKQASYAEAEYRGMKSPFEGITGGG